MKGQLSQEQLQAMMDEQLMKRGVSAELMDIARNGERAYAKVLDVVPLGTSGSDRVKLRLTMSITKSNGDVFEVVTEKEVSDAVLPKVQQGNIVRVVYSPQDPSKLVLEMQATDADVKGTFGA
ncbi:hypothetical protein GCM10010912_67040 [Paenibacillus albidus]|uniref:Uncharacterized protein n=1 Tax=Paenibacillus albidus TaxID=2041023 RepID=A0A917D8T1_9BACL|nr:hypothetical protein [Paenibacillus albidus]GGG13195.1 hypothetical protein GCM10010912_67040 [Paenibacillus albidus]